MNRPVWNKAPLTCPTCRRHFAIRTIRIVIHNNHWVCHRCALNATTGPAIHRAMTLEQHKHLEKHRCATCYEAIGGRQTTINVHGQLVHRHCPKKLEPNRRDRRNRRPSRTRAG